MAVVLSQALYTTVCIAAAVVAVASVAAHMTL